jgi:hypothetical protein
MNPATAVVVRGAAPAPAAAAPGKIPAHRAADRGGDLKAQRSRYIKPRQFGGVFIW